MPPAGTSISMTGGPSTTVTGNVPTATACVAGSTAMQRTLLTPSGNCAPEPGWQSTGSGAPAAVEAPAAKSSSAPAALLASTDSPPGSCSAGDAAPVLAMPTGSAGDGQLSTQPPPAGESTTCPNVSSCQP